MCRVLLLLLLLLVYVSSSAALAEEKEDEEAMMASHLRGAQGGMAEVVFALDRSGSVGAAHFEVEKGFVESFLTHVVVDVNATRVAVLSYSDSAVVHVDLLRSPGNKCALSQALQEVRYIDSRATNIVAALEAASTIFDNARPGVHKVLLLLSDGVATAGGPPGAAAGRLRAKGVEVWCLGVGREARGELLALATSPQHVYSCDTFTDFRRLAQRIRGDPHEVSWSSDGGSVGLCRHLCSPYGGEGEDPGCCDPGARCSCALLSGTHACVCGTGHFGLSGLPGHCTPCPLGSYKSRVEPSTSCTACPRGSTTRQTGSTSLAHCVCAEGHQGEPAKGEECMRVRCPPLQAPPNGFLLGECVPLFGSECVFGCEEGFELANPRDDIRTCRANGTWSGDNARCQRIECRRPPGSSGGGGLRVRCTHHHHRYFEGTRCSFSCGLGHLMQGSAERECLPSKRWSGTEPVCIPVECEVPPPLPRHGSSTCPPGVRPKFRETCAFRCMPGFRLRGPAFLHCDADGRLRPFDPRLFDQTPTCQDVEPPELQCPSSRALATEEGREGAHVSWSGPFASDNGGQEPTLHAPGHLPLYLAIGTHTLQYVATDQAGLSTTCTFTVRIIDEEPPRVLRCPSTVSVVTDELKAEVFWEEPLFQDNSRKTIAIEQSRRPGDSFSPGLETVTYRAYDESRNLAECSFDVIVSRSSCPYFPGPANGALACDDLLFGSFCEVMCEENFDFAPHPPAHLYVCTADAKWSTDPPDMPLPWPDCTRPVFPGGVRLMASGFYYSGDCSDPQTQVQIRKQFVGRLLQRQPKAHACFQRGACSLDSVRVLCGKRTTTPAAGKRRIRRDLLLFGGGGEDIEVEFEITLHPDHQGELNDTEAVLQSFLDSIRHLQWDDEDAMTTTTPSSPSAAAAEVVVITEVLCRPGSVLTNHDSCMLCPSGTFFLVVEGSSECVDCPSGSFQPLEGQTECELCPNGTSTEHPRAKNDTDCKGICPPGTYSGSGLQTCLACPLGTFQESGGQGECRPCPPGTTTPHVQATSPSDCRELCAPGSRSESGLRPCALCPRGFFQPSPGQRECLECPRNLSTPSTGATDHALCQADVDPCAGEEEEVCHHGGTCLREEGGRSATCVCPAGFEGPTCQLDVDECERHQPCLNAATQCINTVGSFYCNCSEGFSGALCQEEIDECLSSPCRNNGTCLDKVNGFVCACSAGFGGERCELELCGPLGVVCQGGGRCDDGGACDCPQGRQGLDCSYDPDDCEGIVCHNNGTCVDGLATFECVCAAGYSGALCETELDECVDNGCSEGATCRDLLADYECLCPPGHAGRFCETRPSPDFVLHFDGGDLSSLASASVRAAPLASVTASAWVQTLSGGAAALSYAVAPAMDNALALTDCGALTVHLGNQPRLTDVAVDDGRWHHLAFAWQPSGDWRLYKDGELAANGSHLMPPGGKVWGGGTLLIGQEQDTPGGGFSPLESFQGNISRVNVWDRYLSASDVASLCRMEEKAIPGRVVAWPDFLPGVRGQVALIDNALPAIGDTRMDTKTGHDIT